MTSRRLRMLLPALASLAALRVALPPGAADREVVEAIARTAPAAPAVAPSTGHDADEDTSTAEAGDVPGNAFAIRSVPSPPPTGPVAAAPAVVPVAAPLPRPPAPVAAAEPMPPLHVVGTYDDGQAKAVFVATPGGIRIARLGTVLLSDYRVDGIAPGRVALTRVSDQRPFELPLPATGKP